MLGISPKNLDVLLNFIGSLNTFKEISDALKTIIDDNAYV
jgi:hypothetical protein